MDAIELLSSQHRTVDALFARYASARDEEKPELLARTAEMLTIHSKLEEQHFYPFARSAGIQDLIDHSIDEHADMKRRIAQMLRVDRSSPDVDAQFDELRQAVQAHVKEEEERLFPRLREVASEERLRQLGEVMGRAATGVPEVEVPGVGEEPARA